MRPTITQQRECEVRQGLVVRRRNRWGARRAYTDENPITFPASFLFLHITVTDPDAYESEDQHMRAIEGIGISRFPNTGINYNMIVMPSGRIYEGQPVGRRGAHTVNTFNRRTCSTSGCSSRGQSLGSINNLNWNARAVAIAQNVNDPVSTAQVHSIARIGATWKRCGYVTREANWHGHRCVSAKSCPAPPAWARIDEIDDLTEHYTINGLQGEDEMELTDNLTLSGSTQVLIDAPTASVDNALENGLIGGVMVKRDMPKVLAALAAQAQAIADLSAKIDAIPQSPVAIAESLEIVAKELDEPEPPQS